MNTKLKLSFIAIYFMYQGQIFAQEQNTIKLDQVEVRSTTIDDDITTKKVGETKKSAETLNKQQVSDSRDLVKYETGITVVETGRMGASGYAIRGVDENRVGITIDGLRQAETLSSQGFKELFEGYGNFNNTRNGVEMENIRLATITKGSDSIKTGSGSLGGSVMFETKDARDYLTEKDWYFGFKNGYQSRDSQNLSSLTLAGKFKWFDLLIIDTLRKGHETKNYFYDIYDRKTDKLHVGKTREKVDPYNIQRKSTMVKVGFEPHEGHRFTFMNDDSKLTSKGDDLSYSLNILSPNAGQIVEQEGLRKTHDTSNRTNRAFSYENTNQTLFWDTMKFSYSNQRIKNRARSDEYCSEPWCRGIANEYGLKLNSSGKTTKVVDAKNKDISVSADGKNLTTSDGTIMNNIDIRFLEANKYYLDCSKIDCSKKFRVLSRKFIGYDNNWKTVYENSFSDKEIEVKEQNGIKYGKIKNAQEDDGFLIPRSTGYSTDIYHDRELNTDTKQFDINFEKEFELFNVEHFLKYGGIRETTKKSMVDQDGFMSQSIQWWTNSFLYEDRGNIKSILDNSSNTKNKSTFLIPVTTKAEALHIGDEVEVTDWLGLDLNYRYDKVIHKPGYDENIPVPPGMIAGIFVPYPPNFNPYKQGGYTTPEAKKNISQNLAMLLQEKKYKQGSYSLGLNLDPLDWLRVQFKYANAFRAPTSDEIYMTFKHPSFSILPNINLKAETAKTKEMAVSVYKDSSFASFSVFQTDYENFIDLAYKGQRAIDVGSYLVYPFWQNVNRNSAKVNGFEITSHLELGDVKSYLDGFRLGYKLTCQKGKVDNYMPMNALQPTTSVYNIGYSTPNDKYGIDLFITDVAAKKAKDTYNMYWEEQSKNPNKLVKGKRVTNSQIAWRSGNYTVFDLITYAKPTKNFTFGFGLYNITDRKYITWDSARSIRSFGTSNLIDQNTGAGIKRFYAPGRNFKFTWEIKF